MKDLYLSDGKKIWKSKTVWGVIILGFYMGLKTLEGAGNLPTTFPAFFSSLYFQAILTFLGVILTGLGIRDKL